jgi:hypothetical protein
MLSPNASQIETAVDTLMSVSNFVRESQQKELTSAMGAPTLEKIGSTYPLTHDFRLGYELGLQTARIVIAESVALILKHVNPDEVL